MAEDITTSEFISKLSVNSLPDNPAAHGWKAAQIKEKFFGPIYEGLKRLLKEIQSIESGAVSGGGGSSGDSSEGGGNCSCDEAALIARIEDLQNTIDGIKSGAVKISNYDSNTGTITFTNLNGGNSETINIFLESEFSDESYFDIGKNELVIVLKSGKKISIPAPGLLNPAWETDLDEPINSQVPPTTETVKNALTPIETKVDELSRSNARNYYDISKLNDAAVKVPDYIDGGLYFTVIGTDERVRVDISSNVGGGSSGGGIARRVPFQKFYATKDTQSYDYTVHDFGENRFAARIFVDSGMQQCNSIMKLSFTPTNLPVIIHPYSNIIVETNPCVLTDFDYSTYQNILKHITPQVEFNYCYDQPGYYDGSFQVSWLIDEYDTYYYSQSFDFIVELEIEYDYTDEYASVLFIRITPVNW